MLGKAFGKNPACLQCCKAMQELKEFCPSPSCFGSRYVPMVGVELEDR